MNLLFLSRWFPYPPDNGSKVRIYNLIKSLARRHTLHLVTFAGAVPSDVQLEALRPYCRSVTVELYRPFRPYRLKALLGLFSAQPRSLVETFRPEMRAAVAEATHSTHPDAVIASQLDMLPYLAGLPASTTRILEELELTTLYEAYAHQREPLRKFRNYLTWWKLSTYVARRLSELDGCTVASDFEAQRVRSVAASLPPLAVIPNGVDLAAHPVGLAQPAPDHLIYSGAMTYAANLDAVRFFLRDILPLIRARRPQVHLAVTGSLEGVTLKNLPGRQGVTFTGHLADVHPAIAASWVSVVPLRSGGGTRLKILEALALGTPVVTTRKGAEGLDLEPERDVLIADEPAEFANAVVRVLADPALREHLSQNGRRAVEAHYDWRRLGEAFCDYVDVRLNAGGAKRQAGVRMARV